MTFLKRNTRVILALIISVLFAVGVFGNTIVINTIGIPSEANTIEIAATVTEVRIAGEGDYEHYIVYTEEYGDKISTYNFRGIADMDDYTSLRSGQRVLFRTMSGWIDDSEQVTFIPIYSMKTESGQVIVSLDDYNEYMSQDRFRASIAGVVASFFLLLVSVYCILLLKRRAFIEDA